MNSTFMYFEGAVSKEICDGILNRFKENQFEAGTIANNIINKETRDTDRQWANPMDLVECILFRFAYYVNNIANWNFDITNIEGACQISRYKPGQFYKKHIDSYLNNSPTQRKVSVSLLLNGGHEYEGGELCILDEKVPTKKQGTVVVFPSFFLHEVTPVTCGERYSAVCWIGGPKWK